MGKYNYRVLFWGTRASPWHFVSCIFPREGYVKEQRVASFEKGKSDSQVTKVIVSLNVCGPQRENVCLQVWFKSQPCLQRDFKGACLTIDQINDYIEPLWRCLLSVNQMIGTDSKLSKRCALSANQLIDSESELLPNVIISDHLSKLACGWVEECKDLACRPNLFPLTLMYTLNMYTYSFHFKNSSCGDPCLGTWFIVYI